MSLRFHTLVYNIHIYVCKHLYFKFIIIIYVFKWFLDMRSSISNFCVVQQPHLHSIISLSTSVTVICGAHFTPVGEIKFWRTIENSVPCASRVQTLHSNENERFKETKRKETTNGSASKLNDHRNQLLERSTKRN